MSHNYGSFDYWNPCNAPLCWMVKLGYWLLVRFEDLMLASISSSQFFWTLSLVDVRNTVLTGLFVARFSISWKVLWALVCLSICKYGGWRRDVSHLWNVHFLDTFPICWSLFYFLFFSDQNYFCNSILSSIASCCCPYNYKVCFWAFLLAIALFPIPVFTP